METTTQQVTSLEGLESFGASETVNNISDFLSLEEVGIVPENSPHPIMDLDEVDKPKPVQAATEDIILPLEKIDTTEVIDIDLGEDNNSVPNQGLTSNYKSIVQDLIEQGVWGGIEAFETENGPVPFDEMDIDKDTFVALMKHNQEELKTKLTENSVSTEGISDFTKKLISIEKHGGNVQQAVRAYETIKEPLNNIDITDVRGQRAICFLRLQQQGIAEAEARDLIESYENKGVLEDKAISFKEQLDSAFDSWLQKQEENAIESDRLYRESLKTYKSSLNEALKSFSDFNLSETHRRKLLDIATKEQEDGSFELDLLLDNHRKNPIDAAELILYLTDKDEYLKNKTKVLLDAERKKTLKTINIIPTVKSSINLGGKTKKDDMIMSLDKLK